MRVRMYDRPFPRIAVAVAFVVALAEPVDVCAQSSPPTERQTVATRPRIGVAFGGGSARGLAHVGVIRWLEEHRIPIDLVAGTSMGGLIGGAFASGMSSGELTDLTADGACSGGGAQLRTAGA
jgi:NTE family protein